VNAIAFRVGSVPPGRYYVRVRAFNANGVSVPGDEMVLDVGP
jgi:hypothetical protein